MIRLILVMSLFSSAWSQSITVATARGPITGYEAANGNYTTFFGVPYAKVDEDNPFGNSIQWPYFRKPFNANDSTIRCPQAYFNPGGVLQCLTLNIYVPNRSKTHRLLPILTWFHGGGFGFGSGGEYGGQHLVQHDVIVITANYRLGPYGFLCLDDPKAPGNQGLKDQISALRWIRKNIFAFGGDASRVTIAGESYGGGGVDLHLYSSYETLFDKAIIQSGSVLAQGFYMKPDYNSALKLAQQLGHRVNSTKEALNFLAKDNPIEVMEAAKNLSMQLTVCKEKVFKGIGHFITTDPFHLNNTKVANTSILIGCNSKEDFVGFYNKTEEFYQNLGNIFYKTLKDHFTFDETELVIENDLIKAFYLGNRSVGPESSLELSDFSSDFKLNYPTEWSVDNYLRHGAKVFKYLFSYTGGSLYENATGVGAYHTEELRFLFQWTFGSELTTDEQRGMRNKMTNLWANFVKYGNPTPTSTELLPVIWEQIPINGTTRPYYNIDFNMTLRDHVYRERMEFWDKFWTENAVKAVVYSGL